MSLNCNKVIPFSAPREKRRIKRNEDYQSYPSYVSFVNYKVLNTVGDIDALLEEALREEEENNSTHPAPERQADLKEKPPAKGYVIFNRKENASSEPPAKPLAKPVQAKTDSIRNAEPEEVTDIPVLSEPVTLNTAPRPSTNEVSRAQKPDRPLNPVGMSRNKVTPKKESTIGKPQFAKVSQVRVRMTNCFIHARHRVQMKLADAVLEVVPLASHASGIPAPVLELTHSIAGHRVTLLISKPIAEAMTSPALPLKHFLALPADLRLAAGIEIFEPLTQYLGALCGSKAQLQQVKPTNEKRLNPETDFGCALEEKDRLVGHMIFRLTPPTRDQIVRQIAKTCQANALDSGSAAMRAVRFHALVALPELTFTQTEFSTIEVQDILLFGTPRKTNEHPARLIINNTNFCKGTWTGNRFAVAHMEDLTMSDNPNASAQAAQLKDLIVNVTCVLGKRTLTLADLDGMGEGTVLELNQSVGQMVDILANGALFGRGEIVQIDDHLGVRILELNTAQNRAVARG